MVGHSNNVSASSCAVPGELPAVRRTGTGEDGEVLCAEYGGGGGGGDFVGRELVAMSRVAIHLLVDNIPAQLVDKT